MQVKGSNFNFALKGWTPLVYVFSMNGNPPEYSVKSGRIENAVGGDARKVLSAIGVEQMLIPVVIAGTVQEPSVSVKCRRRMMCFGASSVLPRNKLKKAVCYPLHGLIHANVTIDKI